MALYERARTSAEGVRAAEGALGGPPSVVRAAVVARDVLLGSAGERTTSRAGLPRTEHGLLEV